jgi:c-di-GMP-binding flagellar brake protein YcgR
MKPTESSVQAENTAPVPSAPTEGVRGAVRFPLHLDITLSTPQGECKAVTEDVSANGMLFISDQIPAVGTQVEFRIAMPAAVMGSTQDVLLHCIGRIVRHTEKDGKLSAAAVIDEYSLKAEHL